MARVDEIIQNAKDMSASDIHISVGLPTQVRVHGKMKNAQMQFPDDEIESIILEMLDDKQKENLKNGMDLDFSWTTASGQRNRVNVFRQQAKLAATIRLLNDYIPSLSELNMPEKLYELAEEPRGLILVTGPTGSGKSTTLAAMIEYINQSRPVHIMTFEDPIEYTYKSKLALVHQRELGRDVPSFAAALKSALREDPDIILVGEMRDFETISAAVTAAETGHLVFSTLHTTGAAQTIDRIIDTFPSEGQNQIRSQLSTVLKGVITQCLVPTADGKGRRAATEILIGTDAVGSLIRENKIHQIPSTMQSGMAQGMHTLNMDLAQLVRSYVITKETAYKYTNDKKELEEFL